MYRVVKDEVVQQYIKLGLFAFKKLAKEQLKERWKYLSLKQRVNAARSLVFMEQVAKNPKHYFACGKAEAEWRKRAEKYAKSAAAKYVKSKNLEYSPEYEQKYLNNASCFLPGPKELVWHDVMDAMWNPLLDEYQCFVRAINDYEEQKEDMRKEFYAIKIREISEHAVNSVDILESNPVAKLWKQFKREIGFMR